MQSETSCACGGTGADVSGKCPSCSPSTNKEMPEPERTAKNRRLVFNYLDVSTGNLTEEEFRVVERGRDGGVIGDPHEYGAWVYVPAGDDEDAPANDASKYPNIAAIVSLARDLGCRWVNFDQDADFLDGFPSFDW